MRWIDRGPEPDGVQRYNRRYTQARIDFYRDGIRKRPGDSFWRRFRGKLGERSGGNCWYCERRCDGESEDAAKSPTVDHFRPRNRFPELAYSWVNWVFSCHRCNQEKGGDWPETGYVDPSAADERERPEIYFDCDADTGEIIPIAGLTSEARARAQRTIDDLGLNRLDIRFYRQNMLSQFIADWQTLPAEQRAAFVEFSSQSGVEFAGSASMVARQLQASLGR